MSNAAARATLASRGRAMNLKTSSSSSIISQILHPCCGRRKTDNLNWKHFKNFQNLDPSKLSFFTKWISVQDGETLHEPAAMFHCCRGTRYSASSGRSAILLLQILKNTTHSLTQILEEKKKELFFFFSLKETCGPLKRHPTEKKLEA